MLCLRQSLAVDPRPADLFPLAAPVRGVLYFLLPILLMATALSPAASAQDNLQAAKAFIEQHNKEIRPLIVETNRAWWTANVTGKDEAFAAKEETENRLNEALANRERFAKLKSIRESKLQDQVLAREIDVLYLQYLDKQVDPALLKRMVAKANAIEKAFNVFRAKVDGRELTDSDVRQILQKSKDLAERRRAWEASKQVGAVVEQDLKDLVRLRNEAATQLGFDNYHAMQLYLSELSQPQVLKIFDELDELTREPFAKAKSQIDVRLGKLYNIAPRELMPWHYHDPFFQEPPAVYDADLNAPFANADIQRICRDFYAAIGLPIDDVLARSSLYEQPGKSPHAFCTDIDREGDVRVLANIVQTEYWMSTMLHELGHSVYSSKNIPHSLPWELRTDAHILCTEGIAMMFERFSKSADWLKEFGVTVADPKAYDAAGAQMRRDRLLIFSRWAQVMFRFELALYKDPPSQDLNKLWWDLVEKYQLVKRPEGRNAPDYASKIHIVSAPAYYHNYLLGQLFACQVHAKIAHDVLKADDPATAIYTRDPRVGTFLKERLFSQGALRSWNDLTKFTTGDELNAKAFAAEFSK